MDFQIKFEGRIVSLIWLKRNYPEAYEALPPKRRAALKRARTRMNDKQRLNFLSELVKLPTASFHFQDDETAAEIARMPLGFTIRVDASCWPKVQVSAPTLRKVLDKAKRELDKPDDE